MVQLKTLNMEKIFPPTTTICKDNYELQFAKAPEYINNGEDIHDIEVLYLLNRGNVRYLYHHLKYDINENQETGKIESIDFTMSSDNAKLGEIFTTLPYGLIKKNRTGVGATTLELSSRRNSIVVVPTRTLAYEKAKNSKIADSNKYSILYVGGNIAEFVPPSIESYLADETIGYKKFIVVVDSLKRLLDKIGEEHFKDYFIMFDEIDSYQYDSYYRPKMENAFDYYFKFPEKQRCLVSATIGKFSNPLIKKEPIINIKFNAPAPRNINLIHTNDVFIETQKKIKQLIENYPNEKILIALNLVTKGMLPIINSLPGNLQSQCSILCGQGSKLDAGDYYKEVINRLLPSKITFMSCTFFVGIDIDERFHLISVADINHPFTLLSTDKLTQIAGRCRHSEGLLSETIIYSTHNNISDDINYDNLERDIIADAMLLSDFAKNNRIVQQKFPKLIQNYNRISEDDIEKNSGKNYYGSSSIKLVRCVDGNIMPAYFNIDNIIIQVRLKNILYSEPEGLYNALQNEGNQVSFTNIKETKRIPNKIYSEVMEQSNLSTEEERNELINKLKEKRTLQEREALAQHLSINCKTINKIFLEHFIELQKYVPLEKLVNILPEYSNNTGYRNLYNAILIWALDENHPIKITLKEKFPLNSNFTNKEIGDGINAIWNGILHYGTLSYPIAVRKLSTLFCKIGVRTSTYRNGRKVNVYPILSYDVLGLNCEPIERIPAHKNMTRVLNVR